jgi:hypothetical protein
MQFALPISELSNERLDQLATCLGGTRLWLTSHFYRFGARAGTSSVPRPRLFCKWRSHASGMGAMDFGRDEVRD